MANNRTFTIIKPDAVANNYIGPILAKINEDGFRIVAMRYTWLSKNNASRFMPLTRIVHFIATL